MASITEDDERVGSDTPPNSVLTDGEVELFWERGYHVIHDALSPDEISHYRRSILDLVPRDLAFPASWSCSMGRMKPYQVSNGERDQTIDTPELIPLLGNPKCYAVAAQLLRSRRLHRVRRLAGHHPAERRLFAERTEPAAPHRCIGPQGQGVQVHLGGGPTRRLLLPQRRRRTVRGHPHRTGWPPAGRRGGAFTLGRAAPVQRLEGHSLRRQCGDDGPGWRLRNAPPSHASRRVTQPSLDAACRAVHAVGADRPALRRFYTCEGIQRPPTGGNEPTEPTAARSDDMVRARPGVPAGRPPRVE